MLMKNPSFQISAAKLRRRTPLKAEKSNDTR